MMKKILNYSFPGLFFAWAITSITYAQNSISIAKLNLPDSTIVHEIIKNEINKKAIRDFSRKYKNITDARWFKSANRLFGVFFTSEGIKIWIYYDKKGNYEFMLRHYDEKKLPHEVRHLIKTKYYDFNIYSVTEINRNSKTAYVVKIDDKTCWKTIKIVENEMEVVDEFFKK